jgi:hypothetical protein
MGKVMYKVTIGTLFIDGVKYSRGDVVKLTEEQAVPYGVNLELAPQPKPKRTRKKKVSDEG